MGKILDNEGLEFLIDRLHVKVHEELSKAIAEEILTRGINNTEIVSVLNRMISDGEIVTKEAISQMINQAITTASVASVESIKENLTKDNEIVDKISSIATNSIINYLQANRYLSESYADDNYVKKNNGTASNLNVSGRLTANEIKGRLVTQSGVIIY